jgi:uncharacterized protein YlxP (DUF503 family)
VVVVAVQLTLRLMDTRSLKQKRGVVRSLVERLRSRHHLSAAEVGLQDDVRQAQIGLATVSGDGPTARQQADDALRFIDAELLGRAEVIGEEIEELAL